MIEHFGWLYEERTLQGVAAILLGLALIFLIIDGLLHQVGPFPTAVTTSIVALIQRNLLNRAQNTLIATKRLGSLILTLTFTVVVLIVGV